MAPTVVRDGEFTFEVHTRELPYEAPHVHVEFGDAEVRVNLDDGSFMEEPPAGKRRTLLAAFRRHALEIRACWEKVHRR
jgi:hypothetical protein